MDTYEIMMTPDATMDLVELRNYISNVLLVPDTAFSKGYHPTKMFWILLFPAAGS